MRGALSRPISLLGSLFCLASLLHNNLDSLISTIVVMVFPLGQIHSYITTPWVSCSELNPWGHRPLLGHCIMISSMFMFMVMMLLFCWSQYWDPSCVCGVIMMAPCLSLMFCWLGLTIMPFIPTLFAQNWPYGHKTIAQSMVVSSIVLGSIVFFTLMPILIDLRLNFSGYLWLAMSFS